MSGDHTRTIQIATPTVGGLMKFAVKTVTCLGCKTPLKGKDISRLIPYDFQLKAEKYGYRGCPMQELQAENARVVQQACDDELPVASPLCAIMDAVPALSRISTPGQFGSRSIYELLGADCKFRTCCVPVRIAQSFTCARKRRKTWKMPTRFSIGSMRKTGNMASLHFMPYFLFTYLSRPSPTCRLHSIRLVVSNV